MRFGKTRCSNHWIPETTGDKNFRQGTFAAFRELSLLGRGCAGRDGRKLFRRRQPDRKKYV